MSVLVAIPILGGLALVQTAIVSYMPLLLGSADLILITILAWAMQDRVKTYWQWSLIGGVIITVVSGMPIGVYIGAYLGATIAARLITLRVWKVPLLGMMSATFLGTILVDFAAWLARWLTGVYIPVNKAVNLILIPGLLLNLMLSVPIYYVIKDLAGWVYPKEIEV